MHGRRSFVVSLILVALCVGTGLLLIRSYFYMDSLLLAQKRGVAGVTCQEGELSVVWVTNAPIGLTVRSGWQSQRILGSSLIPRWLHPSLASIFDFQWHNRIVQLPPKPGGLALAPLQVRKLEVPMWTLFVLGSPLPLWFFLRGRRKARWGFRTDIRWINLRLRSRIARFAMFSAIGVAIGALVSGLGIMVDVKGAQFEWRLALFILLPVVCFTVAVTRRRIPWHKALLWMSLEVAGCVCFFVATVAQLWNHFGGVWLDGADQLQAVLVGGLVCFLCGAVLLLFIQVKPHKIPPGPYCPQCGYCLIGSSSQVCTECGRAFTFEELGIARDALAAPPAKVWVGKGIPGAIRG